MALVLGVDSSTQSTKVEARHFESGAVVATGSAKHPVTSPPVSEQDPEAWWQALTSAIEQLGDHRRDVVAISVAGQQHGLVLLDDDDRPLRPAKLWNDTTSAPQAQRLVEHFGAAVWADATGSVPVASFTISKLAWVAEHEPDVLRRAAKVMLPHDYLTWRLCGAHVTDRGDASGTGWYDSINGRYVPELLAAAAPIDWHAALPEVLAPTASAGVVSERVASELGLPAGVGVGPGTGDNMAAALGLGLGAGDVAISLGTSGTAFALSPTPTHDVSGAVAGFSAATGDFLPLVCTLNATKVTDTLARWLGTDPAGFAELALAAAADPGTVTLVPYFDGERTPNLPDATGLLAGITNATTREQLALAAHDGVLCGLLEGLDGLRAVGATVSGRIFLIGGGARSAAYRQRAADLSGTDVIVPHTDETVAAGAAVQAAAVAGADGLLDIATRWGLGAGDTVTPGNDPGDVRIRYSRAHDL